MKLNYKNLLLSTATAVILTACGGGGTSDEQPTDNQPTVETKLAKAQLGAISGAKVEIHELGVTPYKLLFTQTTSSGETVEAVGNFDAHHESLEEDKFYLYTVSNGLDVDANDDGEIDEVPTVNKGSFHAIIQGKSVKKVKGDFKVTIASELLYKKVKADINDTEKLEEKLEVSAKEIFQKDIDEDAEISSDDILQYNPVEHKEVFQEVYQEKLPQIIKDVHEDKKEVVEKQAPSAQAGGDRSIVIGNTVTLKASGFDIDGSIVKYNWTEDGSPLSAMQNFTYKPETLGVHTLTLTVTDDDGLSASDRVRITVLEKQNTPPTAKEASYTLEEDANVNITLEGNDADNDTLTYTVVVNPTRGTLSGQAPNLTYTPNANFNGDDRFIFVTNDAKADSQRKEIKLTIKKINDKPVINPADTIMIEEDSIKKFKLTASDTDNDTLTYKITTAVKNGTLTHTGADFTYTPKANFNGNDSFGVKSNDGSSDSDEVTIMITVNAVNDAPTVNAGGDKSTTINTPLTLQATATDIDGEIKSYQWFEGSTVFSDTQTATYTPTSIGAHTLSVTVTDDQGATATDRILITALAKPNTPPTATAQSITMDEDSSKTITLAGNDVDNDALTYTVVGNPTNGTLSGTAPNLTYTPKKDYFGTDSFTFKANDGKDDSAVATVSIMISDVEEPDTVKPVITLNGAGTITIAQNTQYTELGATATDDRDTTITVSTTGTVNTATAGTYTITYTGIDEAGNKATETRTVTVVLPADVTNPVITLNGTATVSLIQNTPYTELGATATDDRDTTVTVSTAGSVNTVILGTYTVIYTATDIAGNKATTTRTVTVTAKPNTAPIATAQSVAMAEDTSKTIMISGTDVDQDNLTYTIKTQPTKGKLTGTAPNLTYTPNKDYFGADSFTFIANDGKDDSAVATVSIMISDVEEPDTVKPVITLNGAGTITLIQNTPYAELGATATDVRDGTVTVTQTDNIDNTKVGTYKVTYTAKDKANNTAIKTRTITVVLPADTVKPVITLNGAGTITLIQNTPYTELGATVIDARDGNITVKITGTVNTATIGTYTVTYTATDKAGNKATKTRVITIKKPTKPFITTWKTDNEGKSEDNQILIGTSGSGYNYNVDWGDGSVNTGLTGDFTHTYAQAGTYTVKISGDFPAFFSTYKDAKKLLSVDQWGANVWKTMYRAFYGCENLVLNATDTPDLSQMTNMSYMFYNAKSFNQNIDDWDVSHVTDMSGIFRGAIKFNQPLSNWNVSNVTKMGGMFQSAAVFNQPIGNWNVSNVTDMGSMFSSTQAFNQPLDGWNVSNVTNMTYMFYYAKSFNQPIGNWNLSHMTNMNQMFSTAYAFNQNINNWDVSKVTNMYAVFYDAKAFNQPLDDWDVSHVTDMHWMLRGALKFNQPLSGWDVSSVTNMSYMFYNTTAFNQNLSNWNVSNVTKMGGVFSTTKAFNQPLNSWDVSNVTDMGGMFSSTEAFNQPLDSWDVSKVTDMGSMFSSAKSFNQPLDGWDVSKVSDMGYMFYNTKVFNQPIANWDVSNVTDMSKMFSVAYRTKPSFNQPLNTWDVSKVTDMQFMFHGAKAFHQPLDSWDVSKVTSMKGMFKDTNYNQALDSWDVSNVTNMQSMFESAHYNQPLNSWDVSNVTNMQLMFNCDTQYVSSTAFNQPLDNWDVSSVTDMSFMFYRAIYFNQPLDSWDVSNVTDMRYMFYDARVFREPINSWDVSSVTNMAGMFRSAREFNQPLNMWDTRNVTDMSKMFFDAEAFNQNISSWDISSISNFSDFSNKSVFEDSNQPSF